MWICMCSLSQLLKTIVFCLSFGIGFSSSACAWWVRTLFTGIQDDPCNSTSVGLAHIFSDHLLVGESHLEAQFVPSWSSSFAPAALHSPAWVPNKLHNCASFNTSSFLHICVCVCVCSNFAKKNSHGLFIHESLPEKKTCMRKDQQWTERWDGNQITSICSVILFVSSSTSSTTAAISSGSPAATVSRTIAVEAAEESLEDAASALAAKTT